MKEKLYTLIATAFVASLASCSTAIKSTGYIPIVGSFTNGMRNDIIQKERLQKIKDKNREFAAQYPNWNKLQEGMTKSQVQSLLGRPNSLFQAKRYNYNHNGINKSIHFDKDTGKLISYDSI